MGTEVVRGAEFGTPAQRGKATEIVKDGVSHVILRDGRGRVIGLAGRSRVDELADQCDQLADDLLAAEGWAKLPELDLMLHTKNLGALATRFEVLGEPTVTLRWTREGDSDGWFRREADADVIFVNPDRSIKRMTYVLKHELWHCSQARRIGDGWANAVRDALDELETEAREMAKSVEHIELLRRV
jgi:hypothetical protein